ncbi:MAG: hypothetical protein AABP62_23755, partial [Planctomycetota bacterium]
ATYISSESVIIVFFDITLLDAIVNPADASKPSVNLSVSGFGLAHVSANTSPTIPIGQLN